jgi:ABC-type transport system substrate-binding protein
MKKKILSLTLAVAMTLSLVGCSGSTTTTDGASTSTEVEDSSKVLNIGVSTAPQNISPFVNFSNRQPVNQYLYETLMVQNQEGGWDPCIAKTMETSDYLTYTFEIFDYVKDSEGNAITASDCVYSLEHARDEAANTWIDSAEVTGDYTFTLTVTDDAPSTIQTAINRAPIVSQAAYEASGDGMSTTVISTAPYKVSEFVSNVSINFIKSENYWQTDSEYITPLAANMNLDGMNFIKIAESAQQTVALETGTVDCFYKLATSEVENFLEGGRDAENFTVVKGSLDSCYCFYFGNESFLMDDENLRFAILYAIDKEAINIGAFVGLLTVPEFYGASDGMSDLIPDKLTDDYFGYDEAKAKDYLAKSNYNNEELVLLVPNEDDHNKIAAIVQGQLMAIGLNVKIESYDNAMFQTNFGDGSTFDIAVCQMGMRDDAFVWKMMSWELSGGEQGALGIALKDAEFDKLIEKANSMEGHTPETATEVNNYIIDHAYGENIICATGYIVFRKELNAKEVPYFTGSYDGERTISGTIFE